ncbi:Glycosyltransferase involved in cell wall biogenesis [Rubellimicrobium mesophilum DSM 19309]|uniref:Glycosyltransferase involved in cell wall biogenesis n=1 Tax=Rubellimicrobium mesophilum DSM 19309 TaxID=442562 RepID=A0A017HS17_9RHOB|nr:glycosyltransferase family A protein [Rubellimicrobium mesophilum]EYD76953.1 Glycosyltransferase involved in cell wall biogenesis [Rubellimicrobium mesophilum DSM 19309]
MTLALSVLALLLASLYAGMTFANLRAYRPPPPPGPVPPRVSVLIPARDEEANIGPALACALASTGAEIEVVVLDDGSTDRTAGIVRAVAAHDPRVRLIPGAPLPPGWIGKQHACWQLSLAASHPLLLFHDADVRLEPEAVARLAAFAQGRGLVSGVPRQVTVTLGERIAIPQILVVLLGYLPLPMARANPTDPRFAAAIGQVLLVTRAAYDASGGHAGMRGTIHDGLRLARAVRTAGFGTDLCDLSGLATCRMYSSWRDLWAGFSKNAREGMATPRALPVWTLLLGGGHVLPFLLLPVAGGTAFGVAALAAALVWLAAGATAHRTRASWMSVLLHPVGVLLTLAIQWNALLAGPRRRPAVWRGRSYDL